jgi:predicted ArsR family transcriptional regulator
MKWPFVSRRRYDAVYADRERLRGERNQFRDDRDSALAAARTAARQLVEADAANRRLHDRNLELGRRVTALAESDMDYAAQLERRVARLKRVGKRIVAAWWRERRRAERLQERLDDAVGLSTTIVDSGRWQPGYKPAPKPEVAP